MARTRKAEKAPLQEEQAGDAAVMILETPASESEPVWVWELED